MDKERKGRRKNEVGDLGIETRTLVDVGEIEGVLGIALTIISVGKTLDMQEVGDHLETWQVLKGTGLLSFIEAGGNSKRNVRFEEGMINQATLGDKHGVANIGSENLLLLITKTHS